jgi:hypothetical protein
MDCWWASSEIWWRIEDQTIPSPGGIDPWESLMSERDLFIQGMAERMVYYQLIVSALLFFFFMPLSFFLFFF